MDLLTAAQMRAIERAAIDSGEVTGLELMERAGRGVVEAILEWRPELAEGERSAVVLCGPGNNGGDGFVVARLLRERGWTVEVFLYGDEAKLPPDAAENARRWRGMGNISEFALFEMNVHIFDTETTLLIDCLFGIGLTRPIPDTIEQAAGIWNGFRLHPDGRYLVSIDLPSGFDSDSGKPIGHTAFHADLTVTFHAKKHGHALSHAARRCGDLRVADIGIDWQRSRHALTALYALPTGGQGLGSHVARMDEATALSDPSADFDKEFGSHKYDHGHALVLSGPAARTGAARLAARGALRIGAGLVTVAAPADAMAENAAHLTAIMLREMDGAAGLAAILEDERINALCLGPGLGVGKETRALVAVACGREPLPRTEMRGLDERSADRGGPAASAGLRSVVLDADALTSFEDDPTALFALLHSDCVLTPHEGEFGRLFPDILEKLNAPATTGPAYSKVDATREAAARAGCVVLFKGADTVIADPSGRCAINSAHYDRAAPWLATAGSGDVLAGMIAGFLARGLSPMAAAESAAWLHVEAGRHLGPGLIAEDIPEALPAILKRVLGWTGPPDEARA